MHASLRIGALAASLIAIGLATPLHAMDKIKVGAPSGTAFSFDPTNVGIAKGFFKERGLDVEKIGFAGGAKVQQAIAAGSIDMATSASTDVLFIAKGIPEKAVAVYGGPPVGLGVIVRMDGSVKSIADLKGKKIAVTTPGSLTNWLSHQFAKYEGWGVHGITSVPVGAIPSMLAALRTKQVSAMVGPIEVALKLEAHHQARAVINFGKIEPDFDTDFVYASANMMSDRADDLKAFLAAWTETMAYIKTHKKETVDILDKVMKVSPEIAGRVYDAEVPGFTADERFHPKIMQKLVTVLVEPQLNGRKVDPKSLYTEAFQPN